LRCGNSSDYYRYSNHAGFNIAVLSSLPLEKEKVPLDTSHGASEEGTPSSPAKSEEHINSQQKLSDLENIDRKPIETSINQLTKDFITQHEREILNAIAQHREIAQQLETLRLQQRRRINTFNSLASFLLTACLLGIFLISTIAGILLFIFNKDYLWIAPILAIPTTSPLYLIVKYYFGRSKEQDSRNYNYDKVEGQRSPSMVNR
jgi:hypothetical protein